MVKKDQSGNISLIVIILLVIAVVAGAASFILLPPFFTGQFRDQLKPKVTSLKSSTTAVRNSIDKIHLTITSQQDPTVQDNLRTSGLLVHPIIGSIITDTNVLGASKSPEPGLVETTVNQMVESLSGMMNVKSTNSNVAGTTTAENPSITRFRQVKDQATVTTNNVNQAEDSIKSITTQVSHPPFLLSQKAKDQVVKNKVIDTGVKPYLDEAQKVSTYYQNLADMLIVMNTKITSFKNSITSSVTTFTQINQANVTPTTLLSVLSQTQVYLDQAKKDAVELKSTSEKLKNMDKNTLPNSSSDYHQHNVKVLEAVTAYFDTQVTVMQSFIDAANMVTGKLQKGTATAQDLVEYRAVLAKGNDAAVVSETQFKATMATLVGEETPLTLSFWQNNSILNRGSEVEKDINELQQSINSL